MRDRTDRDPNFSRLIVSRQPLSSSWHDDRHQHHCARVQGVVHASLEMRRPGKRRPWELERRRRATGSGFSQMVVTTSSCLLADRCRTCKDVGLLYKPQPHHPHRSPQGEGHPSVGVVVSVSLKANRNVIQCVPLKE